MTGVEAPFLRRVLILATLLALASLTPPPAGAERADELPLLAQHEGTDGAWLALRYLAPGPYVLEIQFHEEAAGESAETIVLFDEAGQAASLGGGVGASGLGVGGAADASTLMPGLRVEERVPVGESGTGLYFRLSCDTVCSAGEVRLLALAAGDLSQVTLTLRGEGVDIGGWNSGDDAFLLDASDFAGASAGADLSLLGATATLGGEAIVTTQDSLVALFETTHPDPEAIHALAPGGERACPCLLSSSDPGEHRFVIEKPHVNERVRLLGAAFSW